MRRIVGSLVIAVALVLAVTIVASTARAAAPNPTPAGTDSRPPEPAQRFEKPIGRIGGPGRPSPGRPIRFRGTIDQLPTNADDALTGTWTITGTWVVNGISITVDSETKIRPEHRTPTEGMWANVLAYEQENAPYRADKITLQLREEWESEVDLEGPIEALPEDGFLGTWVVRGISVTFTDTTELRGVTPTVGFNAEVEGVWQDSTILAHRIKVEGPKRDMVELEGTVVATDTIPGQWLIRTDNEGITEDITVTLTLSTCINEREGQLEEGAWVEVKALRVGGELEAIYIKVEGGPGQGDTFAFDGTITALPPSVPHSYRGRWTVRTMGTNSVPVTVIVTGDTEVDGKPAIDATVSVEGILQGNGLIRAQSIEIDEEVDE